MAGTYSAMQRAGKAAEDLAIRTMVEGKFVHLTAEDLIKHRQAETKRAKAKS